ncbi:SNARE-like domain protein [Leptospira ognonensis]|uniref:SNARE-like domain protein n=1 Tax=Leptospira ognonensis TaxID=2484945 RepID=A0A4R9K3Z2_9LEPT|nr:DedA family protein [Leptospira ognonensis]TGL59660.1 SNARE-like domain protein [Leptospira ognonensis]
MNHFFFILFSTLISEDITCISTGILIQQGLLDPIVGVTACTLGIFIGDFLLYLTGKELHGFLRKRKSFQFLFESATYEKLSENLENNYARTIFLSRFMPGTRLPIYTFAGMISKSNLPFLLYTFVASVLWTPLMILISYYYGEAFKIFYESNQFYLFLFMCIGSLFLLYQILLFSIIKRRREEILLSISKISRLEFWPMWAFYIPLVPYVCYLMIRYGSIRNISISNPGIPFSGIANESKSEILSQLPKEYIAKFALIKYGNQKEIETQFENAIKENNFKFPLILKPDVGERGAGVKLIHSVKDLMPAILDSKVDCILQEYHPGPFELGIFYTRIPSENKGKIFSITDKIFPFVIGDEKRTLSELIVTHPRYRFQKEVFLTRLSKNLKYIPKEGEIYSLGFAGNHIQGCLFCDGAHLFTEILEAKIDTISKEFKGFFFGRYDIRYANVEDLKNGKNFKIIELNGAMSESTNLYDPKFSILKSYQILFKQWKTLFIISHMNLQLGQVPPTWKSFFDMMKEYNQYKKQIDPLAKSM